MTFTSTAASMSLCRHSTQYEGGSVVYSVHSDKSFSLLLFFTEGEYLKEEMT